MKVNDTISGFVFAAAGIGIALKAQTFPSVEGQLYGASFFPTIIGIAMIGCGIALAVGGIIRGKNRPLIRLPEWLQSRRSIINFFLVLVALLFFILAADFLGFCATAFILLFGLQIRLGARVLPALGIAAAATAVFYIVFAVLLRVPLPYGIVEQFL